MLWATQVAPGHLNGLRFRIAGEKAGIEWHQEEPNTLLFSQLGKPSFTLQRAGAGANASATHATRIPVGHPEGYIEAFAQLYVDLAEQINAHRSGRKPAPASLLVPTVEDGVKGMRFVFAALESSRRNSVWVDL
ncbi:MAG: hypothetical protein NVS9B4_27530 [Candidatus Acidiferrum sp.]